MTLSLNRKDVGDPVCTHTMYGETEEELLHNAKKHGIEAHGYTEESWNKEIAKNSDLFRKLIERSDFIILALALSLYIMARSISIPIALKLPDSAQKYVYSIILKGFSTFIYNYYILYDTIQALSDDIC